MLLFVTALICAAAVMFAGIPAAVNNANRIHIENGREPNAGIAFMPELIVMVVLWWGVGAALKYFFDLPIALIAMISTSSLLFIWQILQARRSAREYALFVASQDEGSASDSENKTKQNKSQHPTT